MTVSTSDDETTREHRNVRSTSEIGYPPPHSTGFKWSDIGLEMPCTAEQYRTALMSHPRAAQGFMADFAAMRWADVGLLVLPCGRSAHLELGWMAGAGKRTIILTQDEVLDLLR